MNYVPAWVFCIPDRSDEGYLEYLKTEAERDGVPKSVIENLLNQYYKRVNADENTIQS